MGTTIDLGTIATKAMEEIITSGTFETEIKKALEKTISRTIEDLLGSWSSDFGKQFKETVKEKLQVDFSRLEIPLYNEYLIQTAQEMTDEAVKEYGTASFAEILDRMLKTEIKSEYKLSEIIEMFREEYDDDHTSGDCFTLYIDKSEYGSRYIRLDEEEDKAKYSCKYRFAISDHDNRVFLVDISDSKNYAEKLRNAGTFGRFLMQLQLAGSKVVLDEGENEDDYVTEFGNEKDY